MLLPQNVFSACVDVLRNIEPSKYHELHFGMTLGFGHAKTLTDINNHLPTSIIYVVCQLSVATSSYSYLSSLSRKPNDHTKSRVLWRFAPNIRVKLKGGARVTSSLIVRHHTSSLSTYTLLDPAAA